MRSEIVVEVDLCITLSLVVCLEWHPRFEDDVAKTLAGKTHDDGPRLPLPVVIRTAKSMGADQLVQLDFRRHVHLLVEHAKHQLVGVFTVCHALGHTSDV